MKKRESKLPFPMDVHEWAVMLLAVDTALAARTCKQSFPSKECKRSLRSLSRRLWARWRDA